MSLARMPSASMAKLTAGIIQFGVFYIITHVKFKSFNLNFYLIFLKSIKNSVIETFILQGSRCTQSAFAKSIRQTWETSFATDVTPMSLERKWSNLSSWT